MFKITIVAALAALVVPSIVARPVATSNHAATYATEAHGHNRLVANPTLDVVRASDVTIAVPARHASRVIVDAPTVYTCQTRDLIQGSGQVTACYPTVAR